MAQTGAQIINAALDATSSERERSTLAHYLLGWFGNLVTAEEAEKALAAHADFKAAKS